jgi:carboxyl-terminal processing protease
MRLLRGTPGTKVTLTVIRGNAAEPRADRARAREDARHDRDRQDAVAPIWAISGSPPSAPTSPRSCGAQADTLAKSGATQLIIDIRHTAEGPFATGLDAARLFVKTGTLAKIAGRDPEQKAVDPARRRPSRRQAGQAVAASITQTITASAGDGAITLPVTLLVTTGTSGAAELFASALEGNNAAELIGERTLGRAGIQKLVNCLTGAACGSRRRGT